MAAMLIRHRVANFAAWFPAFTAEASVRRAHGARQERVLRSATDPDEIIVLLEWDDLERARLYADSDDTRVAMWQAGVIDQPDIWLLEDTGAQRPEEATP